MKRKETPIPISAKQHPTLLPEAVEAIHLYQKRVTEQTGVKPSINGAINALIIIGERATRQAIAAAQTAGERELQRERKEKGE